MIRLVVQPTHVPATATEKYDALFATDLEQ